MRVIGVIDVRGGAAVHARGGRRAGYAPVTSAAGVAVDGDPAALARVYVEMLGVRALYVADLDAIEGGLGATRAGVIATLVALGAPLWLDAGVSSVEGARAALAMGAARVIVGLETLAGLDALDRICAAVGGKAVTFSLDLRAGVPVPMPNGGSRPDGAEMLAARAAEAGVGTVIVLDLARVGTGAGPDVATISAVRSAAPHVSLVAGGGVRDVRDLRRLAEAGCDGALVASALIDGRLGAAELAGL